MMLFRQIDQTERCFDGKMCQKSHNSEKGENLCKKLLTNATAFCIINKRSTRAQRCKRKLKETEAETSQEIGVGKRVRKRRLGNAKKKMKIS